MTSTYSAGNDSPWGDEIAVMLDWQENERLWNIPATVAIPYEYLEGMADDEREYAPVTEEMLKAACPVHLFNKKSKLNWVIMALPWFARQKERVHINDVPFNFSDYHFLSSLRYCVANPAPKGSNYFTFGLTEAGIEFLKSHGQDVTGLTPTEQKKFETEQHPVSSVFVQRRNRRIDEITNLEVVPGFVLDNLHEGLTAVYNGELYGLSAAHILGA
jgi:hypothetical protein